MLESSSPLTSIQPVGRSPSTNQTELSLFDSTALVPLRTPTPGLSCSFPSCLYNDISAQPKPSGLRWQVCSDSHLILPLASSSFPCSLRVVPFLSFSFLLSQFRCPLPAHSLSAPAPLMASPELDFTGMSKSSRPPCRLLLPPSLLFWGFF